MKYVLAGLLASVVLVGCSSSGDYYKSVDASNARNVELVQAQAVADAARYAALAKIAETGDATAKVAATMALALGSNARVQAAAVAQPQRSEALEWASILVPGVTQGMGIYYNAQTSMNANNNATRLGIDTNTVYKHFASEINDPTVVTQPSPVIVTQPEPTIVQPEVVRPEIVIQPLPTVLEPVIVQGTQSGGF